MRKSRKKSWKKIPPVHYNGQFEYSGGQGAQNMEEEEEVEVEQAVAQVVPHCNYCMVEDTQENLIRPCREAADWHYGCLCYWITASNDRNCDICDQQYKDPRIRRVRPTYREILLSFDLDVYLLELIGFLSYILMAYFMLCLIITVPQILILLIIGESVFTAF